MASGETLQKRSASLVSALVMGQLREVRRCERCCAGIGILRKRKTVRWCGNGCGGVAVSASELCVLYAGLGVWSQGVNLRGGCEGERSMRVKLKPPRTFEPPLISNICMIWLEARSCDGTSTCICIFGGKTSQHRNDWLTSTTRGCGCDESSEATSGMAPPPNPKLRERGMLPDEY